MKEGRKKHAVSAGTAWRMCFFIDLVHQCMNGRCQILVGKYFHLAQSIPLPIEGNMRMISDGISCAPIFVLNLEHLPPELLVAGMQWNTSIPELAEDISASQVNDWPILKEIFRLFSERFTIAKHW